MSASFTVEDEVAAATCSRFLASARRLRSFLCHAAEAGCVVQDGGRVEYRQAEEGERALARARAGGR
eukprot:4576963-Alexandrium_andersonii.AAC.1